ncbi:mucin-13b isoform X2 [Chanodichthys erythropterus]|uniref:mucin-13b isoform X2 n=1 Tax=Chanodichthys erythropterus TaxID=933992 RepID=UPI00351E9955
MSRQEMARVVFSAHADSSTASPSTVPPIPATTSAAPETSTTVTTTAAATTTATQAPETSTTFSTTATATTTATQDTKETTTGTLNTGTTANSTDGTPASTIAATTISTTQGPCASRPCIGDSRCEERFESSFVCICRSGLVYSNTSGCIQTKVFPGSLRLSVNFNPEMNDPTSKQFRDTANKIEDELRTAFTNFSGYIHSVVLSLRKGSIIAEVQNFFDLKSNATTETVQKQIRDAIQNSIIKDATEFEQKSVCNLGPCDSITTTCKEQISGVASCTCKEGYIKSQSTSQVCLACPNGQRAVGTEDCELCPFGFAGFNCSDSYLLVVVVVSTVLSAFLIIFIVALIVVSCRKQKESSSPKEDFSSGYGNMDLHKPTGVPRIPRANPDASWKSNNLEMTNSGSNQALVTRDRPESKERYSDYEEDASYRGQVPPVYSGHGGRGVENGGVQNPYFRQDDDRVRRY